MSDGDVARGRYAWIEPGAHEVASGVYRIPLPLPSDGLRAVNVYAVVDGDGLVLVDSGWALERAREQLETALGEIGYGLPDIRRFLMTHIHRDHYTLGVTLRRTFGTRVSLGAGERPSLETVMSGRSDGQLSRLRRAGADELVEAVLEGDQHDPAPPQDGYELPDDWIGNAVEVELESRTLHVVATPGHTRGHVVLFDFESGLLFSGDHVLPHITPSIGLESATTDLPLGDYLDSLRLMRHYPDMRLLPAHGPVTDGVHGRVDELLDHHERRLEQTARTIERGAGTAFRAAANLGWTKHEKSLESLDVFNRVLAVCETAAHLDLLVVRGALRSSTVDGVTWYRTVPDPVLAAE